MALRKVIKTAGHWLAGLILKVDSQIEFGTTTNPEIETFDAFTWKVDSGDANSWKLRDEAKFQDIMTVDTLNDIITFNNTDYTINGVGADETVNINNQENGDVYVTVGYYLYAGSTTKNISKIEIGSQRNNTNNTYDLRVIDITNANIIAEANALNSGAGVEVVNDLGAISNLPTTPTVLEIQAKRDNTNPGATIVFVRSAKFNF